MAVVFSKVTCNNTSIYPCYYMIFYSDCLNQESALEVTLLTSNAGLKQRDRFYPALSLSLPVSLSGCLLLELRLHALRKPKPHGQATRRYSGLRWGSAYWSALTTGHRWGDLKGDFNPSHGDRHHIKEQIENHLAEISQWLELWCVRSCSATSAVSKPLRSNGL